MDPAMPIEPHPAMGWLPLLLQTSDALFPTGSYAHSLGFEECVRFDLVHDEASLRDFLCEHVLPMLASFELPYLRFAHEAAIAHDFPALAELDAEVGAAKLARETRDASAQLGTRRLRSLRVILPDDPLLAACDKAVGDGTMSGHHVIICGVQAVAATLPLEVALGVYFYQSVATVGSASLKLIRIGQDGVQRTVRAVSQRSDAVVARSLRQTRDHAGCFSPLLEIAAMRHARAHERLFIS